MSEKPHSCNCQKVTRCAIFTHPSARVQEKLNELVEAMTEFDNETASKSSLIFRSIHPHGVFKSFTRQRVRALL